MSSNTFISRWNVFNRPKKTNIILTSASYNLRNIVKNCRRLRFCFPHVVLRLWSFAYAAWLNIASVPKESTIRRRQLETPQRKAIQKVQQCNPQFITSQSNASLLKFRSQRTYKMHPNSQSSLQDGQRFLGMYTIQSSTNMQR